ncbi:MAG: tetratricopeptide repeat protein [Thermoguttaceae bacterium]|nr:tetratricopeptide repeat protein [Thermoguttaceae bacterium]
MGPAAPPVGGGVGAPTSLGQIPEIQEAAGHFRNADYDKAVEVLRTAVKKHPDLPPAHLILAQFFNATNQPANMRNALEQAIAEDPADPEPYAVLAELAVRNRQMTEAGLLYAKVLELADARKESKRAASLRRPALAGLAMVADARKDWPAAQKYLEALLVEEPKNAGALQQLGRVLFHQKKLDEAKKRLQEAAKAGDDVLSAEANLARFYQEAGDTATAAQYMLEAIKANPTDFRTRLVAAEWSLEIGKFDQAETQAQAAIKLSPDSIEAKLVRGTVALFRKDYKTAQDMFEQAHLQAPGNFSATNNLALALVEQDEESKKRMALDYAQINARVGPDRPEANATLGWVYYRLGRIDEAENALRKSLSIAGQPSPDTAYYFARVLNDRGRKEEARRLLDLALKAKSPFPMRPEAEALAAELRK